MLPELVAVAPTLANLEDAVVREFNLVLLVTGVVAVVAIASISGTVRRASVTKQREQTKRELAAYVAEGSMAPEDAQGILAAGESDDLRELVLKRAADGWITTKKAQQILATMDGGKASKA